MLISYFFKKFPTFIKIISIFVQLLTLVTLFITFVEINGNTMEKYGTFINNFSENLRDLISKLFDYNLTDIFTKIYEYIKNLIDIIFDSLGYTKKEENIPEPKIDNFLNPDIYPDIYSNTNFSSNSNFNISNTLENIDGTDNNSPNVNWKYIIIAGVVLCSVIYVSYRLYTNQNIIPDSLTWTNSSTPNPSDAATIHPTNPDLSVPVHTFDSPQFNMDRFNSITNSVVSIKDYIITKFNNVYSYVFPTVDATANPASPAPSIELNPQPSGSRLGIDLNPQPSGSRLDTGPNTNPAVDVTNTFDVRSILQAARMDIDPALRNNREVLHAAEVTQTNIGLINTLEFVKESCIDPLNKANIHNQYLNSLTRRLKTFLEYLQITADNAEKHYMKLAEDALVQAHSHSHSPVSSAGSLTPQGSTSQLPDLPSHAPVQLPSVSDTVATTHVPLPPVQGSSQLPFFLSRSRTPSSVPSRIAFQSPIGSFFSNPLQSFSEMLSQGYNNSNTTTPKVFPSGSMFFKEVASQGITEVTPPSIVAPTPTNPYVQMLEDASKASLAISEGKIPSDSTLFTPPVTSEVTPPSIVVHTPTSSPSPTSIKELLISEKAKEAIDQVTDQATQQATELVVAQAVEQVVEQVSTIIDKGKGKEKWGLVLDSTNNSIEIKVEKVEKIENKKYKKVVKKVKNSNSDSCTTLFYNTSNHSLSWLQNPLNAYLKCKSRNYALFNNYQKRNLYRKDFKNKDKIAIKNYNKSDAGAQIYSKDINDGNKDIFFNAQLILTFIKEFWDNVISKMKDDQYMLFMIKVKFKILAPSGNEFVIKYATIDKMYRVYNSEEQKTMLLDYFRVLLESVEDLYKDYILLKIFSEYWIKNNLTGKPLELLSNLKKLQIIQNPVTSINKISNKFNNIPLNNDYKTWGSVEYDSENFLIIKSNTNKYTYYIRKLTNNTEIDVRFKIKNKEEKSIIIFNDYSLDIYQSNLNLSNIDNNTKKQNIKLLGRNQNNENQYDIFVRVFDNYEYFISNNKVVLKTIKFKTNFLKHIKKESKISNKFITFDIETKVENNVHIPYAICYFDGKKKYSFYVTDFNNHNEMIKSALLSLLRAKYKNYNIYVHNLSNFDGIFILNALTDLSNNNLNIEIEPVIREGQMISINIIFNKYKISFKDSYLLLPLSLKKLSNSFNVEHVKTSFPHNFVNDKFNDNINLNYEGPIPHNSYFSNSSDYVEYTQEYLSYSDNNKLNNWNLKNEVIKYCFNDCISLFEVINNFNIFIFEKFKINVHNYPTLPSLTFAIFRSNYLLSIYKKGYYIPLISGLMYDYLKKSYTGGATDMYIPYSDKNEKVYCNDVNSLYPTNMSEGMFMPVISDKMKYVTYFEGDIKIIDDKPFGFFNCNIETTKYLHHPVLQLKHDTGSGIRAIAPLGKWTFQYFSEEIYNAEENFGYKVDIIDGFIFDKFDVFANIIKDLYKIKENAKKDDPWYTISKLLMNSLYGRFGMNPYFDTYKIINIDELDKYVDNFVIDDCITLNNKLLISYFDPEKIEKSKFSSKDSNSTSKNVSVSISSAITAYARMFMSKYKNSNYKIFYTDTDSLYTNEPLDPELIGNKLGQFKLENTFKEAVFIAPKVYGGITIEGKEITKIKGFKNKISFNDLKELLKKDESVILNQEKWFKDLAQGNISIKDQIYTLKATQNKRELIYENDVLVGTKPFIIGK